MLENRFEVVWLYDFYAPLLTEHRRELLRLYCEEDMSLGEIAEVTGITRQGVYDAVRLACQKLEDYEKKLGMLKRHKAIREQVAKCRQLLTSLPGENEVIKEAIATLEDIERAEK